jgi:hypothetical protein
VHRLERRFSARRICATRARRARVAWLSLALFAIGPGLPAAAFDERDFLGVPWGISPQELKTRLGRAGRLECTPTGRYCSRPERLGGVPVAVGYEFIANRFTIGSLSFASADYAALRQLLVDRFGPPTYAEERPETTRGGATFTIGTVRWEGPAAVVVLSNFGKPMERGAMTMMPREEYERRH